MELKLLGSASRNSAALRLEIAKLVGLALVGQLLVSFATWQQVDACGGQMMMAQRTRQARRAQAPAPVAAATNPAAGSPTIVNNIVIKKKLHKRNGHLTPQTSEPQVQARGSTGQPLIGTLTDEEIEAILWARQQEAQRQQQQQQQQQVAAPTNLELEMGDDDDDDDEYVIVNSTPQVQAPGELKMDANYARQQQQVVEPAQPQQQFQQHFGSGQMRRMRGRGANGWTRGAGRPRGHYGGGRYGAPVAAARPLLRSLGQALSSM